MSVPEPRSGDARWFVAAALVLLAQNLFIFSRHLFFGYTFPWDFNAAYHAVPYYWIEAARHGLPLDWVPFQGMGYPLYLNTQSSLWYPPLWLFVLLDHPYGIRSAIVLQAAHVLWGALGIVICARAMRMSWGASFLAGVFYQGFGGFYGNAQHVDIVRAYALLPWIAAPLFADWTAPSRLRTGLIAALPLLVYALCTGTYFGTMVATLFVTGAVAVARTLLEREGRRTGLIVVGAIVAGGLVAGGFLLPIALDADLIARMHRHREHEPTLLRWEHLLTLVYDVDRPFFRDDVSMRSLFIGVPALALVCLGFARARQWDRWMVFATLLAIAMASGILLAPLAAVVPPLAYSRFPLADYRGFIALGMVLVAARAFDDWSDNGPRLRWLVPLLVLIVAGNHLLQVYELPQLRTTVGMAAVLLGTLLTLTLLWRRPRPLALASLALLALLDWSRVHRDQPYFLQPDARAVLQNEVGDLDEARRVVLRRMRGEDGCRPARVELADGGPERKVWRGYYSGEYLVRDHSGPMEFVTQQRILVDPASVRFAREPWKAVAPTVNGSPLATLAASHSLRCVRYGADRIEYFVSSPTPQTLVENEVFWQGWHATLIDEAASSHVTVAAMDWKGFRAWRLPAGNYRMIAQFEPPHWRAGLAVSLIGLFGWALVAFAAYSLSSSSMRSHPPGGDAHA